MSFESGVIGYVYGMAAVKNPFPIDERGNVHISCANCSFFVQSRSKCGLNGKLCEFPEKYVGSHCPLEVEAENE